MRTESKPRGGGELLPELIRTLGTRARLHCTQMLSARGTQTFGDTTSRELYFLAARACVGTPQTQHMLTFDLAIATRYAPTGQGATHGGDETWLLGEHENGTPGEVTLSHNMALWWASLGSDGNPNTKANKGAPIWPKYNASNAPGTMYLGDLKNPTTFINTTIDTVRIECEHWKPYLGWAMP